MEELSKSKLENYKDIIELKISVINQKLKELDNEWASYKDSDGDIDTENDLAIISKRSILDTKLRDLLWFSNILKQLN